MEITAGVDCEFFVHNGNKVIPVGGGLVPGTKDVPFSTGDGFFVQEDGASVEVNTPYGVVQDDGTLVVDGRHTNLARLVDDACGRALKLIRERAADKTLKVSQSVRARLNQFGKTVDRLMQAEAEFSDAELKLAGPSVFVVGCDPDFSAYSPGGIGTNTIVDYTELGGWRMAGGHIHIGYDAEASGIPNHILVQFMDLLSVRFQLLTNGGMRSRYYGKPGNFRRKPYGIEYRSLTTAALLRPNHVAALLRRVNQLVNNVNVARDFYIDFNWTAFFDAPWDDRWYVKADELIAKLDAPVEELEEAA